MSCQIVILKSNGYNYNIKYFTSYKIRILGAKIFIIYLDIMVWENSFLELFGDIVGN